MSSFAREGTSLSIAEREPLAPRTTLGLGGPARYFATARDEAAVIEALRLAERERLAVALLGQGSNLVVADEGFDGLVLAMSQRGIELALCGATAQLRVAAGEPWDEVVAMSVARDLAGLECLSGIPGLAGATPIQNVGAYGQEVSETIAAVRVLDRKTLAVHELEPQSCGFRYRDSAFKREPSRFVVLAVDFALRLGGDPALKYAELARAVQTRAASPSLADVREAVLELRRAKSMLLDPGDENARSAGSFFLNPVVSAAIADRVAHELVRTRAIGSHAELPRFANADGSVKLAAAFLIERAGFHRGERRGPVGLSSRHTLALVHHGGGRTEQLIAFAREIRDRVRERFGIELMPEPAFLGFAPDFRL